MNYLPFDIMAPFSNIYSEISIPTLEYLDLSHPNYLGNIQNTHSTYF